MGREGNRSPSASSAPSRLPLWYFGYAHLCLAAACTLLVVEPSTYTGFFYHPAMMVPVHLVTLGWISASILGALYLVAPMALRTRLAEGRLDVWAFWAYAIGANGIVSHFWVDSYGGLVWSAALVAFAVGVVGVRVALALPRAPVAPGVKAHVLLAFVNVVGAAALASVVALVRAGWVRPLLPGSVLDQVFAHAHLAALGWATMMVFGVGYRLVPMLLPAAMPPAWAGVATAIGLEAGTLGLVAGLLGRPGWIGPAAMVVTVAVSFFLLQVVWMARHPKPRARNLPRPDFGLLHVLQALVYLLATVAVGVGIIVVPPELRVRLAPVYGMLALFGFLGQMVLGVGERLLPLYGWFRAFAARGLADPPPPPYREVRRRLAALTFVAWSLAVPLLALGLYREDAALVRISGMLLSVAVLANVIQLTRLLRPKRSRHASTQRSRGS